MKHNTTMRDYLLWRGDLPFSADEFNEVDNLVLCVLSYLNFRRFPELTTRDPQQAVSLPDIAGKLTEEDEQLGLSQQEYVPIMKQVARTARFRDVRMFAFEEQTCGEREMQFAAMSFLMPDKTVFIAFRGTDTSLVGWKEDFNMSFLEAVPAQMRAAEYTEEVARSCPRYKLRIGGHSKGGNLAAWAGLHLPKQMEKRLLAVYNNDGPGFNRSMSESEAYIRLQDKFHTFIPESSIVGTLLEHSEDYTAIASTARSVMQHEALSWCVQCNRFVKLKNRSRSGRRRDDVLQEWIGSMSAQERREFTDAFFDLLSMGGKAKTLDEVQEMGIGGALTLLQEYIGADEKKRKIITEIFGRLATDIREEVTSKAQEGIKEAGRKIKSIKLK